MMSHSPEPLSETFYDAIIVGGGISGLTVAFGLSQTGARIRLLESAARVGGVIQSAREQGFQTEAGPNTFLKSADAIRGLAQTLGLTPCGASSQAKNRYIYRHQRLLALPTSLGAFIKSPLLSLQGKARLLCEPAQPARRTGDDESVASLMRRRLGPEALAAVINPFLAGVYAGDPETLSAQAVFPKLAAWERQYGGFVSGALAARFSQKKPASPSAGRKGQDPSESALYSFEGGMEALPNALAAALPAHAVLSGAAVIALESLRQPQAGYRLTLADGRSFDARSVILATPADTAGRLLGGLLPAAPRDFLASIPYASVSVAHLGVERAAIPHALDGFGCLIPRGEGVRTLGAIWASALFPNRAPQDYALLSAFIGGMCDPELADWDDAMLANAALADISGVFHCPQPLRPVFQTMTRWRRAIPQAVVGHPARVESLRHSLAALPGVFLAGNYLNGVSVNDCVREAHRVAAQAQAFLQSHPAASAVL
ncbi:MAG: protoporphyrinogen oxidase [Vampirovibrionales bacterium]|nr:protoporphyrinogen oxidase [Vampirovibrionales bacterium]